jgi:hypothetical protein
MPAVTREAVKRRPDDGECAGAPPGRSVPDQPMPRIRIEVRTFRRRFRFTSNPVIAST